MNLCPISVNYVQPELLSNFGQLVMSEMLMYCYQMLQSVQFRCNMLHAHITAHVIAHKLQDVKIDTSQIISKQDAETCSYIAHKSSSNYNQMA